MIDGRLVDNEKRSTAAAAAARERERERGSLLLSEKDTSLRMSFYYHTLISPPTTKPLPL